MSESAPNTFAGNPTDEKGVVRDISSWATVEGQPAGTHQNPAGEQNWRADAGPAVVPAPNKAGARTDMSLLHAHQAAQAAGHYENPQPVYPGQPGQHPAA